jgi:SAM-dependent methyltransferase
MTSFTLSDSIIAKFEFAKFRDSNSVYFDYRYNVSDAALKYLYILQRIENKINHSDKESEFRILELGCGDGHLLKIINQKFKSKCTGFDPILKTFRVKVSNFKRDKLKNQNRLLSVNHEEFTKMNSTKYDIVFDSCSLTHFDTTIIGSLNQGWLWALENIPHLLRPNGIFICATDISELSPNNEFLNSDSILKEFSKIGNIKSINEISSSYSAKNMDDIYIDVPFLRIASSKDTTLLNVLGFELSFD